MVAVGEPAAGTIINIIFCFLGKLFYFFIKFVFIFFFGFFLYGPLFYITVNNNFLLFIIKIFSNIGT